MEVPGQRGGKRRGCSGEFFFPAERGRVRSAAGPPTREEVPIAESGSRSAQARWCEPRKITQNFFYMVIINASQSRIRA